MRCERLKFLSWILLVFSFLIPANVFAELVLRVCDDVQPPASLDPFRVFSEKTHTLIQQSVEGLLRFNEDGKIESSLAERWEMLNSTTTRFYLRKGVFFHNNEPFNADAVKFSLEKYINPETKYLGFPYVSTIARVDIVDEHTVDIVTHIPDGLLLNRLAAWCHVVPKKYYTDSGSVGFSKHPIGTGPFKFESWSEQGITFSKNKSYWLKGFPLVDKLAFSFIPPEKQIDTLLGGGLDILTELPGTFTLKVAESPLTKIVKKYTYNTVATSLNTGSGPLRDVRIRKALNYAINKDEMIYYDLRGNGRPLATVTMDGEEGHNKELQPYPFDLKKAKALVEEAMVGKEGIDLKVIAKEQGRRTIGIIKKHLEPLKIYLNVHYTDDANIIKDVSSGKWDIVVGNCSDPMINSFFIQSIVYYSKSPFSLVHDPVYDGMLESMMITLDPVKRKKAGEDLDSYIYNNALGIFTYQRLRTYGVSERVEFPPYVSGMPYFFKTKFVTPPKHNQGAVDK
jgi:peptide/nickel transport system substrate-binding protein